MTGTRYYPWRSYRDLPAEHPVFHYPAHVREKLYGEGIGTFCLSSSSPPFSFSKRLTHDFVGKFH